MNFRCVNFRYINLSGKKNYMVPKEKESDEKKIAPGD
jgi:hypothetical protein